MASDDGDEKFTLNIKTLDSTVHKLVVTGTTTIGELKTLASDPTGIPVNTQRLIFQGKVLHDDKTLTSYGLKEGLTVHLVKQTPRPPGSESSTPAPSGAGTTATHPGLPGFVPAPGQPGVFVGTYVFPPPGPGVPGGGPPPNTQQTISNIFSSLGIQNAVPPHAAGAGAGVPGGAPSGAGTHTTSSSSSHTSSSSSTGAPGTPGFHHHAHPAGVRRGHPPMGVRRAPLRDHLAIVNRLIDNISLEGSPETAATSSDASTSSSTQSADTPLTTTPATTASPSTASTPTSTATPTTNASAAAAAAAAATTAGPDATPPPAVTPEDHMREYVQLLRGIDGALGRIRPAVQQLADGIEESVQETDEARRATLQTLHGQVSPALRQLGMFLSMISNVRLGGLQANVPPNAAPQSHYTMPPAGVIDIQVHNGVPIRINPNAVNSAATAAGAPQQTHNQQHPPAQHPRPAQHHPHQHQHHHPHQHHHHPHQHPHPHPHAHPHTHAHPHPHAPPQHRPPQQQQPGAQLPPHILQTVTGVLQNVFGGNIPPGVNIRVNQMGVPAAAAAAAPNATPATTASPGATPLVAPVDPNTAGVAMVQLLGTLTQGMPNWLQGSLGDVVRAVAGESHSQETEEESVLQMVLDSIPVVDMLAVASEGPESPRAEDLMQRLRGVVVPYLHATGVNVNDADARAQYARSILGAFAESTSDSNLPASIRARIRPGFNLTEITAEVAEGQYRALLDLLLDGVQTTTTTSEVPPDAHMSAGVDTNSSTTHTVTYTTTTTTTSSSTSSVEGGGSEALAPRVARWTEEFAGALICRLRDAMIGGEEDAFRVVELFLTQRFLGVAGDSGPFAAGVFSSIVSSLYRRFESRQPQASRVEAPASTTSAATTSTPLPETSLPATTTTTTTTTTSAGESRGDDDGYTTADDGDGDNDRSEERRVGKECRSRWSPYH
eukprot:TRINITY_DN666_c1_g1_i2.p1 TRINITY_DN666_c1_g1~~TRINITY_DN666_c1_g1_i2.p1  ORF type:complete len:947 (+),score=144.79 TRINITY_DN666_c1_g1_i2:223-3063(+)